MKKRLGSRLHNDSSVRVYTCVHGRKKYWKGYTGEGDEGNQRTKRRGPGWQTEELSIIRESNFTLRPRTASRIPYNVDPFLRAGFGSYCTVLARERWENRSFWERFDCSLINYGSIIRRYLDTLTSLGKDVDFVFYHYGWIMRFNHEYYYIIIRLCK